MNEWIVMNSCILIDVRIICFGGNRYPQTLKRPHLVDVSRNSKNKIPKRPHLVDVSTHNKAIFNSSTIMLYITYSLTSIFVRKLSMSALEPNNKHRICPFRCWERQLQSHHLAPHTKKCKSYPTLTPCNLLHIDPTSTITVSTSSLVSWLM